MTQAVTKEKKYLYKPSKKNDLFMEYWVTPTSETFGNVFKSGLRAGFSRSYSKNLLNIAPQWLLTYIDRLDLPTELIKQGIYDIALNTNMSNSRSPNDTKLKAYEILSDIHGMIGKSKGNNVNITVQPILMGKSVERVKEDSTVIDSEVIEQ